MSLLRNGSSYSAFCVRRLPSRWKTRVFMNACVQLQLRFAKQNGKLEAEVASRTAELHAANQSLLRRGNELDDINRRLEQELADRMRTEKERAELQERIIRTQQARLAEMATPLIPISSDVVVMPLIGTVDSERASQILDTALTGRRTRKRGLSSWTSPVCDTSTPASRERWSERLVRCSCSVLWRSSLASVPKSPKRS